MGDRAWGEEEIENEVGKDDAYTYDFRSRVMIKRPMLAGKADFRTLKYPILTTPKLDGIRALKLNGRLVSRNFKDIPNRSIQDMFKDIPDGCDGELIIPGESFNVVSSEVMSQEGEFRGEYFIFDHFLDKLSPYIKRMQNLEICIGSYSYPHTKLLLPTWIKDEEELLKMEEIILNDGYEGVMIRSIDGPYKEGRSTTKEGYLLKLKRFEDSEAVIIDFNQRMTNMNEQTLDAFGLSKRSQHQVNLQPADTLGSILVEDINLGVRFSIGSGFNEEERKSIWSNQEMFRKKIVKYKWQHHGSVNKPRFPIFLGFRS